MLTYPGKAESVKICTLILRVKIKAYPIWTFVATLPGIYALSMINFVVRYILHILHSLKMGEIFTGETYRYWKFSISRGMSIQRAKNEYITSLNNRGDQTEREVRVSFDENR